MSRLFLSYRRADSPDTVKLLHERLSARLPRWQVFYDHRSIEYGDEFPEVLRQAVTDAIFVIVIIGPRWLEHLQSRRTVPIDYVREEVRLGLELMKTVVPVTVQNAIIPSAQDLAAFPELTALATRNCLPVRPEPDFDNDLDRLVSFLQRKDATTVVGDILAGKYRLIRTIGEGGMGVVFEAEQIVPPKRLVAVKLIRLGMATKDVLSRFDAERQALARMKHENIARVLDAGSTPDNRPYFVMDRVHGEPITRYCDRKKLLPQERLAMFCQVCDAIQHAHNKGVIHRDITPANILVEEIDGRAVPKVIDFGLARALQPDDRLTDKSLVSENGRRIGTLLYSSPEQLEGRASDVDTRTDIYSLGALLYELLTGVTPFSQEELLAEGERVIVETIRKKDPLRPSDRLSSSDSLPAIAANRHQNPEHLTRLVRGDLDWIVMKSLEKEVQCRYETPSAFALDVQRYLQNEPIAARPHTTWYRLCKSVRRNRGVWLTGSLLSVALLAGVMGTTWGMLQARRARDDEARQREIAQQQTVLAQTATQQEQARAQELRQALKQVTEEQSRTERSLANNRILLAEATWNGSGSADQAHAQLDAIPEQHRHWEWGYLKRKYEGCLAAFYGHTDEVVGVGYSPDGQRLLSVAADGSILIRDAVTGEVLQPFPDQLDRVQCAGWSADGRLVALALADGTMRIRELATGSDVHRLDTETEPGLEQIIASLSFSPDGQKLVSGSLDGTIRVWNTATGERLLQFHGRGEAINSVQFSPDGTRIASGAGNRIESLERPIPGKVVIWDAATGQLLKEFTGTTLGITGVRWSPEGRRIAAAVADGSVIVWNAMTSEVVWGRSVSSDRLWDIAFTADGLTIVVAGFSCMLSVRNAANGEELMSVGSLEVGLNTMAISPECSRVAGGCVGGAVRIWNLKQKDQGALEVSNGTSPVSMSPDGIWIASKSAQGGDTVAVWDSRTGQASFELPDRLISAVCFSATGSRMAWATTTLHLDGSESDSVIVADAQTGERLTEMSDDEDRFSIQELCFSHDGNMLLAACDDLVLRVWDVSSGQQVQKLQGHTDVVNCVCISLDGSRIVSGSDDRTIRIWNRATGDCQQILQGHGSSVTDVCLSPDGTMLASSSSDRSVCVRDTVTGRILHTLPWHSEAVIGVDFSSDGSRLASFSVDGQVRIWDPVTGQQLLLLENSEIALRGSVQFSADGECMMTSALISPTVLRRIASMPRPSALRAEGGDMCCVRFSPNGDRAATGSRDGDVCLWETDTGERLFRWTGHSGDVNAMVFDAEGRYLVTAGQDIRVWDVSTGEPVSSMSGHGGPVTGLSVSPDGRRVASCSWDGMVRVWNIMSGQMIAEFTQNAVLVRYNPDGTQLATVVWDQSLRRISILNAVSGEVVSENGECPPWLTFEDSLSAISPDGKWFWAAEPNGAIRRVSLDIPPDELAYRRLIARPDPLWHREQAEHAQQDNNWFAARFHWNKLLQLTPDDSDVQQQLNEAQQRLAE